MFRTYKCLSRQEFTDGRNKLIPIREEDRYDIMNWRNEQIDILRQKQPLNREKQDAYFKNFVTPLFNNEKPDQLLFSFLEDDILIGYGGLVHIDWESRNAEVSFITKTNRNLVTEQFIQDWKNYLKLLKTLIRLDLFFNKIYTYAYDIRPHLYEALTQSFFKEEARLKNHISINGGFYDVVIHSYFFNDLILRLAQSDDVMLYFNWANDHLVRNNSFNQEPIELKDHKKWFSDKLASPKTVLLLAMDNEKPIAQIRFDETDTGNYEIDFSVDKLYRGKNIGSDLLRKGTEEFFRLKPSAKKVIGKVKTTNFASIKSFEKLGFKRSETEISHRAYIYYFDNR